MTPASSPANRRTLTQATSNAVDGAVVQLLGRVLATDATALRLTDESGEVQIIHGGLAHAAGDWVRLDAHAVDGVLHAEAIAVLTPHRGARPFPSPGGEYFRLHSGPRARAELLRLRARCLASIRAFFDGQGYVEVQPPGRVRCPGLEPHLVALESGDHHLITSPEYQMKRLLAGGMERIYALGPCWRGDEVGAQHLTEFCMLEWYQAFSGADELMTQTEQLLAAVAQEVLSTRRLEYQGRALDLSPPFARISVSAAFAAHAGVDLTGVVDVERLRRRAEAAGHGPFTADEPFEGIASRILVDHVEPALARLPAPVFLHDFPAPLAALSRLKPDDPTVADRFELYAGGIELANAFGELTDPDEQLRRLEQDRQARQLAGAPVHPVDQRFIDALREGMPPAAGIALGVDRLLMLLCDEAEIGRVVAFGPDEV
jgi:elongation factor P--(R)-beta-lysine ligase